MAKKSEEQVMNWLAEAADINRPLLVTCSDFSRAKDVDYDVVKRLVNEMVKKSEKDEESEQFHPVFYLRGYVEKSGARCMMSKIVNQCNIDCAKESMVDVQDVGLYGFYKGCLVDINLLKACKFTDSAESKIIQAKNCKKDGNALRTNTQQAGKPAKSSMQSKNVQPATTADYKPEVSADDHNKIAKFFERKASSKKEEVKKKPANKRGESSKQQTLSFSSKMNIKKEIDTEENKANTSDKENLEKEEPKHRRVLIASESDSSDEEPEKNGKPAGTLLDQDDLQFESEEEQTEPVSVSEKKKKKSGTKNSAAKAEKKRKRASDDSIEDEHEETITKKNKSVKEHNFGKVKSGEKCPKMRYVDKTFLDDDGFLVTEKVLEMDPDCSNEETKKPEPVHQEPVTKQADKEPARKQSKAPPKQQSSLLSFFKKK